MSDPPDEYEDVNETVAEEWVSETTPYDRVRQTIAHTYEPVSAGAVAEDAQTTPKTARKHLDSLADEGFVVTAAGDRGGTAYRRSPESLVVEQAADIIDHVSTDELATRVAEMRDRLQEYRAEYGVDGPEELAVERANQTLSGAASDPEDIDAETVQEWQTLRRNLAFANAALSIANAERFVGGDLQTTGDDVPA